jgi:hypothetical protein
VADGAEHRKAIARRERGGNVAVGEEAHLADVDLFSQRVLKNYLDYRFSMPDLDIKRYWTLRL